MNDPLTVEPGVETQETSKQSGQPAAAPAPRLWTRPVFERVRLNEALGGGPLFRDGKFTRSS